MAIRHQDLHFFIAVTRVKRIELAKRLKVSRFQLAGLLYPDRYPVVLTDDLVARLSELLNQPESYVREFYRKPAA